jgi:hypothetical protein
MISPASVKLRLLHDQRKRNHSFLNLGRLAYFDEVLARFSEVRQGAFWMPTRPRLLRFPFAHTVWQVFAPWMHTHTRQSA